MKKQQGNIVLILLAIAVFVFLGIWYFMKYGYNLPQQTAGIQNTRDLDMASKDLDSTNLNEMDSGTSQISADSSSF